MAVEIGPLLARLKRRYTRLPRAAGLWFDPRERADGVLVRTAENRFLATAFTGEDDLKRLFGQVVRPHVLVLEKDTVPDGVAAFLGREHESVIYAGLSYVMAALGLSGTAATAGWFACCGLDLRPKPPSGGAVSASLLALAGLFYLADEYEYRDGGVVPLLFEGNPLYTFLRLVPYGEVTTFAEIAKALGLQWTEQPVMAEVARLPGEAEVFGHRVVHRDGRLSELFPGGAALQRELLKWEMVPFVAGERVDMKRALWTRQKYRALTGYLRRALRQERFIEMSFPELERVAGFPLSRAARRLGSWWSNDRPHAWIWQAAGGRVVNVNMKAATVVFGREQKGDGEERV